MSRSVSEKLLASRYHLLDRIGTGGMANVHRAWDEVLRRHVAVKVFQPGFDPAAGRRFDNEVRTLANLSHPGLVSVYDADTEGPTPYVVMQLVEGQTLRERIAEGPLALEQARRLGAGLADALACVHAHGFVHRDVKPSNILLDAEDNAYLADFGLAHLDGATRLTRTDQLVGTAAYLAPEQVLGGEIGHQTDVYALGLVVLECLTARREYQGSDVEAAVARLHRPPVVPEELPADVRDLLTRMTASSPEDRPTAEDCARLLAVLPVEDPPDPTARLVREEVAAAAPAHPARRTVLASTGALLAAFGITWVALSGPEPQTAPPASTSSTGSSAEPATATPEASPDDTPQPEPSVRPVAANPQVPDSPPATMAPEQQAQTSTVQQAPAPTGQPEPTQAPEPTQPPAPTQTSAPTSAPAPTTTQPPAPTTTSQSAGPSTELDVSPTDAGED